jgi:hypothetical protein
MYEGITDINRQNTSRTSDNIILSQMDFKEKHF